MRRLALAALAALASSLAAACYQTPTPECAFLCGEGGACPSGYACAGDGWCKRADLPDDHDCGEGGPAAEIDAGPAADAAPDAASGAAPAP